MSCTPPCCRCEPPCLCCVTERVAIDLEHEDADLRQLLDQLEDAQEVLSAIHDWRVNEEALAGVGRRGLTDSARLNALCGAEDSLDRAYRSAVGALCSSGTMTDEPPF